MLSKIKTNNPLKQNMQFENRLRCQFLITVQSVGRRKRRHRALPRRKWGSCLRAPSVGFRCTPETTMSPPGERKILYTQTGAVYQVTICAYSNYKRDLVLKIFGRRDLEGRMMYLLHTIGYTYIPHCTTLNDILLFH